MSGFAPEWLKARRPIDAASRSPLPTPFLADLEARSGPLRIADLGSGTGANAAFLQPLLPPNQAWRLFEHDPALIAAADVPFAVNWIEADLSTGLEAALDGPADLVTGSALLDLVSADWLERLADLAAGKSAAVHFALTYDGLQTCRPRLPFDVEIATLFNRHQRGEKGFGPALGNEATATLREMLAERGYVTATAGSPWRLGGGDAAFTAMLLEGIATAALEGSPDRSTQIEEWLARRLDDARSGRFEMVVGHLDLFAWPKRLA